MILLHVEEKHCREEYEQIDRETQNLETVLPEGEHIFQRHVQPFLSLADREVGEPMIMIQSLQFGACRLVPSIKITLGYNNRHFF